MNPARQRKLLLLASLSMVLGIAIYLILYALRQNISLFYSPSEVVAKKAPLNHAIRVGGMVVPGSITRQTNLAVAFQITDYQQTITVHYQGVLPDLFREGQGVVVQGQLISPSAFKATEVLAKHDEKYMPPEVKSALAKSKSVVKG